jgi:hypothetical protein
MEVPQKTKNRTAIRSSNSTLRIYPKECKSGYNKGNCTPMLIAALFTMIKYGNSQDASLVMNGLRKCSIYIQWNFIQP